MRPFSEINCHVAIARSDSLVVGQFYNSRLQSLLKVTQDRQSSVEFEAPMLEKLSGSMFSELTGERFVLRSGDAISFDVTLMEVELGNSVAESTFRQPFSLIFLGPLAPVLPQGNYQFEHEAMEPMELFTVPIGPIQAGMRYQVIFS